MKKDIQKIALIRLSALGDIINSAIVLEFIHNNFANASVTWVCEEVFAPILRGHPLINKVETLNLKKIKKDKNISELFATLSHLRNIGDFDIVIDIQGLLKSAVVARLIGKNTHGFDKHSSREPLSSLFYKTTSNIAYEQNVIKRNCFVVGDALGFEINDGMILEKKPIFGHLKDNYTLPKQNNKKNIAIVIGASWKSKKYPKEKIAQLCTKLQQNSLIIWGNDDEMEDALWICDNAKGYATPAPKLTLKSLVSFISQVDLLIGNDTGPTHIAWAQNIPSITLFGPTTSRMIYETPINSYLKSPSKVDISKINKNDFSIKDIEVVDIVKKAKELLK